MYRVGILVAILSLGTTGAVGLSSAAWPLRATITDPHGRSIRFRALSLGGHLIVNPAAGPRPLAPGDTLSGTTPWSYPLDLKHGPVMFFSGTGDSIRVVVGRNPFGAIRPVSAQGRRLTVRLISDSLAIDVQ